MTSVCVCVCKKRKKCVMLTCVSDACCKISMRPCVGVCVCFVVARQGSVG